MRAVALMAALAALAGACGERAVRGQRLGWDGTGRAGGVAPCPSLCLLAHCVMFPLTACRPVAASSPNSTEPQRHGGSVQREPEVVREGEAVPAADYEEDEEYEEAPPVHQYIVDDLIRGEPDGARCEAAPALRALLVSTGGSLVPLTCEAAALGCHRAQTCFCWDLALRAGW